MTPSRAVLALLYLALAAGCAHRPGPSPAAVPADTVDAALVGMAATMNRSAAGVGRVWPGFWGADQAFLLLSPAGRALLVTPRTPPPEYVRAAGAGLPSGLAGRPFRHAGYPAGLGPNRFSTAYALGGDTIPALEPKGASDFERLDFYFHEAFHGYQGRRFAPSRDGDRRVRFRERLVDSAVSTAPEFTAAAEAERRALVAALDATSPDSVRALARAYLALRERRTAALPRVRAVERSMERMEGTATLVGCGSAAVAVGEPPALRAAACARNELTRPLLEHGDFPEADARLMRWRLYGTGAAIGALLDRLSVDWRPQVERGESLDLLLAERVGFTPP